MPRHDAIVSQQRTTVSADYTQCIALKLVERAKMATVNEFSHAKLLFLNHQSGTHAGS